MLLLSHPAGLWALLALPAILLIHCLQERTRRIPTSTLFLLERARLESISGSRFERLRTSVPLWLQLLAATCVAWLLAEPRWIRQNSRQTIVVLLDSSASMSAFQESRRALLRDSLGRWNKSAAHTDWHLLETDPRQPTLYTGQNLPQLLAALDRFEPTMGTHSPDEAWQVARGLVKENGMVLYVSDHEIAVPEGIGLLAVGQPVENVGFTGVEVTAAGWKALLQNHSEVAAEREWWLTRHGPNGTTTDGAKTRIALGPRQGLALEGSWPSATERAELRLTDDAFGWDDRLPMILARPRVVRVAMRLGDATGQLLRKMLASVEGVEFVNHLLTAPDLTVAALGTQVEGHAILAPAAEYEDLALDAAWTVAEEHRLTRDLNWMGLLTPAPATVSLASGEEPLLWKGSRLLASYQPEATRQRLSLLWPLAKSNAERSPALLVLLQRFLEEVRAKKTEPWAGNFETRQPLPLPENRHAPERPGFFTMEIGGKPRLSGAAYFADARESDFRAAKAADITDALRVEAGLRQSEEDPFASLWMLGILACLLGSWAVKTK